MAYENFKPLVMAAKIEEELGKLVVLEEGCNNNYEGEVGEGKRVKILGIERPTVGVYTGADIGDPEEAGTSAIYLDIDQMNYFNYCIKDIDRAASVEGIMESLARGAAAEMAQYRDTFVASLATGATYASTSASANTADKAIDLVDKAITQLWTNGVPTATELMIEITPWFYMKLKSKLTALFTDNVQLIKNGRIGMYTNSVVKISNNLYNDGSDDYMFVRTKNAITFAGGINEVEAYRTEKNFKDAVKGLSTYGGRIVRPEQLYVIKAHNS